MHEGPSSTGGQRRRISPTRILPPGHRWNAV